MTQIILFNAKHFRPQFNFTKSDWEKTSDATVSLERDGVKVEAKFIKNPPKCEVRASTSVVYTCPFTLEPGVFNNEQRMGLKQVQDCFEK